MNPILWIDNQDAFAGFYIETPKGAAVSQTPRDCTVFDHKGKANTRAAELIKEGWEVTILFLA